MATAPVYRNIERRQQYLGVEPIDLVVVLVVLWLLLSFNPGSFALNLLAVALCYAAVRVAKRGKPEGYTLALLRYALSPSRSFLSAAELDNEGRLHPFRPTRH